MGIEQLIGLLVQFGPAAFDLAETLIGKLGSKEPLTVADIAELRKMGKRTSKDAIIDALVRGGVPLESEQATKLLAMV